MSKESAQKITLVTFDAYEEFGLVHRLTQTAEFRERTAEKYPDDTRNAKAVDLLNVLRQQNPSLLAVKSLNDAIVEYDAAREGVDFDSEPPPFEPKVSAHLDSIGFGWHPKNIDEVLLVLTTDARLATNEVTAARSAS